MELVEDAGFTSPVFEVTKHVESISTIRYYSDADADADTDAVADADTDAVADADADEINVTDSSVNLD